MGNVWKYLIGAAIGVILAVAYYEYQNKKSDNAAENKALDTQNASA